MENIEGQRGQEINENTLYYWQQMTPWTKFFSILGFVLAGLYTLAGIGGLIALMSTDTLSMLPSGMTGVVFGVAAIIIGFIVVLVVISLNHWRFTENIKAAIDTNSQDALDIAWKNMAQSWRIYGYMMIITLVLYVIILVVAGSNAMAFLQLMQGSGL